MVRLRKRIRRSNLCFKFIGKWIFTNLSEDFILILNNGFFFYQGIFNFENIMCCSTAPSRFWQLCIIRFFVIKILLVRQHDILYIFFIGLFIFEANIAKMILRTRCSLSITEFFGELRCLFTWRPNNLYI